MIVQREPFGFHISTISKYSEVCASFCITTREHITRSCLQGVTWQSCQIVFTASLLINPSTVRKRHLRSWWNNKAAEFTILNCLNLQVKGSYPAKFLSCSFIAETRMGSAASLFRANTKQALRTQW